MRLKFLNRQAEKKRLKKLLAARESGFACLYGRRRCGKSRLILEVLHRQQAAYYVGDERNAVLQREALATAITAIVPGFDEVQYPGWENLLTRWFRDAPRGSILAIDEFPHLVSASPELPSLLQKMVDQHRTQRVHLLLCGSSQRMMQGLVLDATAPLYGRANEILKIEPLRPGWIQNALSLATPQDSLEAWSIWGGIPRYWELASDFRTTWQAVEALVLDPLGILHHEPNRLLLDDMRETAQAATILTLIGRGCHRMSEIAGRMNQPATSLTRPLRRLQTLGLVQREIPFGASPKSGKRSLYRIADPLMRFWFRYVEPNRSRLEAGQSRQTARDIRKKLPEHLGQAWEELARSAVPCLTRSSNRWLPAARWWGRGINKKPIELDIVAQSVDGKSLLVGEAKLQVRDRQWLALSQRLEEKINQLPFASRYQNIIPTLFVVDGKPPKNLPVKCHKAEKLFSLLK